MNTSAEKSIFLPLSPGRSMCVIPLTCGIKYVILYSYIFYTSYTSIFCLFMTFCPLRNKSVILVEMPKSIRSQIMSSHCLSFLPQWESRYVVRYVVRYDYVETFKPWFFRVHMMQSSTERFSTYYHQLSGKAVLQCTKTVHKYKNWQNSE